MDLDGARLDVRQQYARDAAAGLVFKSLITGTAAWRTVDLNDETAAVLRAHLEAQEFRRRSWVRPTDQASTSSSAIRTARRSTPT